MRNDSAAPVIFWMTHLCLPVGHGCLKLLPTLPIGLNLKQISILSVFKKVALHVR
jgi:hypothetical protein